MHSLKDTHFLLRSFLFIVPVVKNDLKRFVNHQFIVPSLYNQITQLIFITDIFRSRIKCTTLCLFVRGQSFSVKTFDRSRSSCQVIRLGAGDGRPSGQVLPLPSRVSLSPARSFFSACLPLARSFFLLRVSPSRPLVLSSPHVSL